MTMNASFKETAVPLLGADPEFFLMNQTTGDPVPIIGMLGGTKDKPQDMGSGFYAQEDNVMAEYNIPPCPTRSDFAASISAGQRLILNKLNADSKKTKVKYGVYPSSEAWFPQSVLEHPQAATFGCSTDYDGYTMGEPCQRVSPDLLRDREGQWRFSGGHLHLGYKDCLRYEVPEFVVAQMCDAYIWLMMHEHDHQPRRRTVYGTPGRFRPKPYGIEYRTLSSYWTVSQDVAATVGQLAFDLMYWLMEIEETELRRVYSEIPWTELRLGMQTYDNNVLNPLRTYCRTIMNTSQRTG